MKMKNTNHLRIDGDALAEELGYKNMWNMKRELARMKFIDPGDLVPEELDELTDIEIDDSLTLEERALSLLRQTRNPYFYRYDGMIVTLGEAEQEALDAFLVHCLYRKRGRTDGPF